MIVLAGLIPAAPHNNEDEMGTKNNPGRYDCYAKADPDEPMFILLARDPLAPEVVRLWATMRKMDAKTDRDHAKVAEALRCADAMEEWAIGRGGS